MLGRNPAVVGPDAVKLPSEKHSHPTQTQEVQSTAAENRVKEEKSEDCAAETERAGKSVSWRTYRCPRRPPPISAGPREAPSGIGAVPLLGRAPEGLLSSHFLPSAQRVRHRHTESLPVGPINTLPDDYNSAPLEGSLGKRDTARLLKELFPLVP
ncbi:hypothetical protein MRX96_058604 [Rhipicephalus microplus]